jgi:hypothetical protein
MKIIYALYLLTISQIIFGQQSVKTWEKWNFLIGEWKGEGSGQPGQNEGSFSFHTDLDGKILVRKNRTVFPATANSVAKVHDDLLIVYPGDQGALQEAIYFDNEGNIIRYKVSFTENSIVLTSNIIPDNPRFRLSYVTIDNMTVNIIFEISSSRAPEDFIMYLSGKAFRVK